MRKYMSESEAYRVLKKIIQYIYIVNNTHNTEP